MRINAAAYTVQADAFAPSAPRLWSEKASSILSGGSFLDTMPDGKRFIVVLDATYATLAQRETHVTFLLNFADWLRHAVPAAK